MNEYIEEETIGLYGNGHADVEVTFSIAVHANISEKPKCNTADGKKLGLTNPRLISIRKQVRGYAHYVGNWLIQWMGL